MNLELKLRARERAEVIPAYDRLFDWEGPGFWRHCEPGTVDTDSDEARRWMLAMAAQLVLLRRALNSTP